jgi:3-phenylpropionate/cinnamic acid dioxygenase small subunit
MTRQEAEDFLYREARLLDSGQLEEWVGLFAADDIYWRPIDEQADPEREPSIIYDDATQRAKRVF